MANIIGKAKVEVSATMTFTEEELRALNAITKYGVDSFLKVFYERLGTSCLRPHEKGLRSLFDGVMASVPRILSRANEAREAFDGKA